MTVLLWLWVVLSMSGCATSGYSPHYILSDQEAEIQELPR